MVAVSLKKKKIEEEKEKEEKKKKKKDKTTGQRDTKGRREAATRMPMKDVRKEIRQ